MLNKFYVQFNCRNSIHEKEQFLRFTSDENRMQRPIKIVSEASTKRIGVLPNE